MDVVNSALQSWFDRLAKNLDVSESTYKPEDLSLYGFIIRFSRYRNHNGELSHGFRLRLSIYEPPKFKSMTDGFADVFLLIDKHCTDVHSFLPSSDEYEVIKQCLFQVEIYKIDKKIKVTYEEAEFRFVDKGVVEEWTKEGFDVKKEFSDHVFLK